jgi:hypothetical protein
MTARDPQAWRCPMRQVIGGSRCLRRRHLPDTALDSAWVCLFPDAVAEKREEFHARDEGNA